MSKAIKYIIIASIVCITLYNSVYTESLAAVKKQQAKTTFNAKTFAIDFMNNKVVTVSSIDAIDFITGISKNTVNYCQQQGKKLGISSDYYFIIDGAATVIEIEEENVLVSFGENSSQQIRIATDFIFGNAIREGGELANIGDFQNTMDYNNISVEINNIVRETVVPPFVAKIKTGDHLHFKGAVKVNTKNPNLNNLKVIPLHLEIE